MPTPPVVLSEADITALIAALGEAPLTGVQVADMAGLLNAVMAEYCTRGYPVPVPPVIRWAALGLARRWLSNPAGFRTVSAGEQSIALPAVGFSFLEQVLLSRYRFRSA